MMTEYEAFRSHILTLDQDQEFQEEATQIRVKALLSDVAEQIPPYAWSYIPRRVVRNISFATFELENIARNSPDEIDELTSAAGNIARTWEALARLRESTTKEIALLNAAVNYELAGYQANAMCLAKKLVNNGTRLVVPPPMLEMSILFLQRRILQLRDLAKIVQIEPPISGEITTSLLESMALALAGNAFSLVSRFLLPGERASLETAINVFQHASKLFASLGLVEESNLVDSISSLLPVIDKRTTWTLLSPFVSNHTKWQRYLKLLARGAGTNVYVSRSISELWPSQIEAVQKGLLNETSSKIVKMPTSAGKTRIAELAIVNTLITHPEAKCVYIAPYRALVSELEQSFLHLFSDLGYRVSSVTGNYESDDFEELLFQETDVIVATPEKLDLLLRTHPEFLSNVRLFVVDEVHIVQDKRRGLKFELLLTRIKQKFSQARFLLLSAVVSQKTLEDFVQWFKASSQKDIMTSTWRPSVQRHAMFESVQRNVMASTWYSSTQQSSMFESVVETGILRYVPEGDLQSYGESEPPTIFRQQEYQYTNPQTGRRNRKTFPDMSSKPQIAAELVYKLVSLGSVLVFCTTPQSVKAVAKALQQRLLLASLTHQHIPDGFKQDTLTRSALLAREWLGDQPVTSWLESRIGVHYGDLPDVVRKAVETDFRQRNLPVMIATNTLAQGVNLPVRTVIIHSCNRYDNTDGSIERIPARDYWNIAGRAGRAGEETEGLIVHIKVNDKDKEDYEYYLRKRDNVEPIKSALYQKLVDLIESRLSKEVSENIEAELDAEILALLVEESEEITLEDTIQKILEGSLMQVQAEQDDYPTKELHKAFIDVAHNVASRVSTPDLRILYSSTGLSSISCQRSQSHITENDSFIRDLFASADERELEEIMHFLLPLCLDLPEMKPQRDFSFGGSYNDLLVQWVKGTDLKDLVSEFGDQVESTEELGKIIDVLFRYHLPWGISAYIRIAKTVLNLDSTELSDKIKFLPSMVKFGLPDPMACWAMSAGIPFRRTALEIAAAFRDEVQEPNYYKFLQWLNNLDSERLHNDFGLTDIILEDVSRTISISGINPLMSGYTGLDNFLPCEVTVKGVTYQNRSVVALSAQIGQRVELVRDYDNEIDRNAIVVHLSGREMGYVPRDVAQVLATEIDIGANLEATIVSLTKGKFPKVSVRIVQNYERP